MTEGNDYTNSTNFATSTTTTTRNDNNNNVADNNNNVVVSMNDQRQQQEDYYNTTNDSTTTVLDSKTTPQSLLSSTTTDNSHNSLSLTATKHISNDHATNGDVIKILNENYYNDDESYYNNDYKNKNTRTDPESICFDKKTYNDDDDDDDDDDNNDEMILQKNYSDTNNYNTTTNNEYNKIQLSTYDTIMDKWLEFRLKCGHFVNHKGVQFCVVTLIIINALVMGIETFPWVRDHPTVAYYLNVSDTIFLAIFTIELVFQIVFYSWRFVQDGWILFDFIVITISWGFERFRIVRAFRIFRSIRLITRVRTMKNLLTALFGVMPRLCAVGGLLIMTSYIFAVMLTEMFKDTYIDGITTDNFFGTLGKTSFTLFQIMTLDNWADMTRDLCAVYWWAWMPIVWFVVASGFVIANLIIAVICDAVAELKEDDKAKLHGQNPNNANPQQQQQDEHIYSVTQNQGSLNLMSTLNGIYSNTNETSTIMMKRKMEMLELYMNTLTQMQNDTLQALLQQQQVVVQQQQLQQQQSQSQQEIQQSQQQIQALLHFSNTNISSNEE